MCNSYLNRERNTEQQPNILANNYAFFLRSMTNGIQIYESNAYNFYIFNNSFRFDVDLVFNLLGLALLSFAEKINEDK